MLLLENIFQNTPAKQNLQTKVRTVGETLELLNSLKAYGKPASPSMPYHGKK